MPRSPSTYSLPPGTTPQQPNTVISSSMFNAFADDVAQTFNTVQPIAYGGTGVSDLKLNDTDFGIKDNSDPTKIGQFNASNLPTATTRTYDLPYYSGTLGLVSDIRGQIYGLTLSNNVTDATNDIDIAAGAAVDSTGAVSMLLASAMGKQLDVAWAVGGTPGAPAGMRASGAAIANTTYHIFLIRRPDTGVVDIAADTSVTGANIAANTNVAYTQIRRIGSIIRSAGAILRFYQNGDHFNLDAAITVRNSTAVQTNTLLTMPVPIGIKVRPVIGFLASANAASSTTVAVGDGDAAAPINVFAIGGSGTSTGRGITSDFWTNTSGQIRFAADIVGTITLGSTYMTGWVDSRGKNG